LWKIYIVTCYIIQLRISALKKEYAELIAEEKTLDLERDVHFAELQTFNDEEQSHFKNHPLLNDRYLFFTFLGKGGYGEVYKVSISHLLPFIVHINFPCVYINVFQAFDLKEQRYVACKIQELDEYTMEADYLK